MRCFALALAASALVGCANDPLYIPGPSQLEAGQDDMSGEARASLVLPIRPETMVELAERTQLAAELMLPVEEVPYVRLGDLDLSVEWTIKNLEAMPGQALIQLNGANELWAYEPAVIPVGEDDPAPPGLEGDRPIEVAANGSVSGVFREDQLREASVDLDQITRGNINPFRATLTLEDRNATEFAQVTPVMFDDNGEPLPQTETGMRYPRAAFAQIVRVDLVFRPSRHMVLEYTVRVRDTRGILHDLLQAAPPEEIVTFAPMVYIPAAPPP